MNNLLTVYETDLQKIRIGKHNDGGYILADIKDYDCIISAGIGRETTFEKEIAKLFPDIPLLLFDPTIEALPEGTPGTLYKQAINKDDVIEFHAINHENILLKMDVEGSETDWISVTKDLPFIRQMVIEFHGIEKNRAVFEKINITHRLIHVHGNNYGGITEIDGIMIPNVIECTYLRKDLADFRLNTQPLPGVMDSPNNPVQKDYDLNYNPFVWKT